MSAKSEKDIIAKLENLSKICTTQVEKEKLAKDFDASLKCINELLEVNTDGVNDWFYNFQMPIYEDKIKENMPDVEDILSNTPSKQNNMIRVPKFVG